MLTRIGLRAYRRVARTDPWTNVYGLARTLIALAMAGTLAATPLYVLFVPTGGAEAPPSCGGVVRLGLFCVFPREQLEVARWTAVALLLVVASGWRPRLTGVLHWWVAASFNTTVILADGGDQAAAVLTFLLVPLTLTDDRRWHWQARPRTRARVGGRELAARTVALASVLLVRVQMAGIYFHAAVGKLKVEEWADGTAVYYWFTTPVFGAPGWLEPLLMPVLRHPLGVAALTWGALVLEMLLFTGLVMDRRHRPKLLVAGILFHAGILVVHGLISFVMVMWAGLILFLWPVEKPFAWLPAAAGAVARRAREAATALPAGRVRAPARPRLG